MHPLTSPPRSSAEGLVDVVPGRKLARQHPPGAARAHHVAAGVHQGAAAHLRRSAPPALALEQVLDQRPLRIGQATRVALVGLPTAMGFAVAVALACRAFDALRPFFPAHAPIPASRNVLRIVATCASSRRAASTPRRSPRASRSAAPRRSLAASPSAPRRSSADAHLLPCLPALALVLQRKVTRKLHFVYTL